MFGFTADLKADYQSCEEQELGRLRLLSCEAGIGPCWSIGHLITQETPLRLPHQIFFFSEESRRSIFLNHILSSTPDVQNPVPWVSPGPKCKHPCQNQLLAPGSPLESPNANLTGLPGLPSIGATRLARTRTTRPGLGTRRRSGSGSCGRMGGNRESTWERRTRRITRRP